MSHITDTKVQTKFEDTATVIRTLTLMKSQFPGMTYEESKDGKIIQIRYAALDDPVKNYHSEGNLRFSQLNDGSWKLSGDRYGCRDEYDRVVDAMEDSYLQSGFEQWSEMNNYSTGEETTDENRQRVFVARRY
jgi:hypothetical protein